MTNCELCKFQNPKGTATAVIIKDNKILVLRRNEEPFKGTLDLPGGFMNKEETPEVAIRREMKEELNVDLLNVDFITTFSGYGFWKEKKFPVLTHAFFVDIGNQEIKLNEENSEYLWIPLKDLNPNEVGFDTNQELSRFVKHKFTYDLEKVKNLIHQLDSSANLNEQYLYRALLNGFVSTIIDENNELVAMGWIFPRQTMLRKQAVIEDMIVDEKARGKGYGDVLIQNLEKWAITHGMEVIELTSGWHRKAAHGLYEKHGFKIHDTAHMLLKL